MGIGNAFPTVLPNADYSYYTLKLQALKLSELGWKYLRNYWGRLLNFITI